MCANYQSPTFPRVRFTPPEAPVPGRGTAFDPGRAFTLSRPRPPAQPSNLARFPSIKARRPAGCTKRPLPPPGACATRDSEAGGRRRVSPARSPLVGRRNLATYPTQILT